MPTITLPQIEIAFALAQQVYDGQKTLDNAANELKNEHGWNINSARDALFLYRHLLRGEVFKRTLSALALEYFLAEIEQQHGRDAADNAVAATWKHIAYYESIKSTNHNKLRSVVHKFQNSLSAPVSTQVYESNFNAAIEMSKRDSSAAREMRLKSADTTPAVIITKTKTYLRNPDVVAEVLIRAAGNCELCKKPAPFQRKSDGTPFLEVHHKEQLAHGGKDTVQNAIAVCPNCHRKQHHG